jgi:hypothetical protein
MRFEEILKSGDNVLTNTYALYIECNEKYKTETKLKKCWKLLDELCDIMESFTIHLFKDFKGFGFSSSVQYITLAKRAEFIWKESNLLRKKVKRTMVKTNTWRHIKSEKDLYIETY